jgi:hypothetical protein
MIYFGLFLLYLLILVVSAEIYKHYNPLVETCFHCFIIFGLGLALVFVLSVIVVVVTIG